MTRLWPYLPSIAKAINAGVVSAVAAGVTATIADDTISTGEWWMIAAAGVTAFAGIWATPNAPTPKGRHAAKEEESPV